MAKWNEAVSVTFNDNDGGAGWSANPESAADLHRHHYIFGVWRTRWILLKKFWKGLMWLEGYANRQVAIAEEPKPLWVFKADIPE